MSNIDSDHSMKKINCRLFIRETDGIYVHNFNIHLKEEREQKKQYSCENNSNTALLMLASTLNY